MKSFKEFIGTTGVRIGNYSNVQPIASLGDVPPKKRAGGKNVRGVGLHAGYTTSTNQRPFLSADPRVEPKTKKKENTMGGMVHVRGAQPTASMRTRKK
jgi:hypothetical protein|tara:strand:+ start:253 stop:546 length:294 start_codon:yes stop_codon:yes gene_type:complete